MKTILSEKNLVVLLFVLVLITFSLAHEDTKKMVYLQNGANSSAAAAVKMTGIESKDLPSPTITVIPAAK